MAELGWDARVGLAVYGSFNSREYLNAQRIRNRQMQFHKKIFAEADVIVTPTTGVTAYPILDDALKSGELDYINRAALVRYQIAGNFLGLPAVTIPVGYDKCGLPIGLQFIGEVNSEGLWLLLKGSCGVPGVTMPKLCGEFEHHWRDGKHGWQDATLDEVFTHIMYVMSPPVRNELKMFYGKAPAVVELCMQAGAQVPEKYKPTMRLDIVVPENEEASLHCIIGFIKIIKALLRSTFFELSMFDGQFSV